MKRTRTHHSQEFKQEPVNIMAKQRYRCAEAGHSFGGSGVQIERQRNGLVDQAMEYFRDHGKRTAVAAAPL